MKKIRVFFASVVAILIIVVLFYGSIMVGQFAGASLFSNWFGKDAELLGFFLGSGLGLLILKLASDYLGGPLGNFFNRLKG